MQAKKIAKSLLGKFLVRSYRGKPFSFMIVETEAYVGPEDKASHSFGGRRTKRNEPMWGSPNHWYVYLTYGMHYMLNLVVGEEGYPAAVLIRGVVAEDGTSIDGPGKLTKALHIDARLNGKLASRENGLWIEDRGIRIPPSKILKTPRIGINCAEEWKNKPLRFVLKDIS